MLLVRPKTLMNLDSAENERLRAQAYSQTKGILFASSNVLLIVLTIIAGYGACAFLKLTQSAVDGSLIGGIVSFLVVRWRVRRRTQVVFEYLLIASGRCVSCGHQLTSENVRCPECGSIRMIAQKS